MFFEERFSRTREGSDVSRAHAAAPAPVRAAPETLDVVSRAMRYARVTGGAFDVTMGTVARLWDFRAGTVPGSLAVSRALAHAGCDKIRLDVQAGTLALADAETVLDLGGIAKGYIADDLAALLAGRGVDRYVLDLGGNLMVSSGEGDPWRVGVAEPGGGHRHCAVLEVRAGSVVTSGVAERSFARGGRMYHHILDPRTGFPAKTDALSMTAVSDRSVDGDALATAALVLGVERGLDLLASQGFEGLAVGEDRRIRMTSGLIGRVELVDR